MADTSRRQFLWSCTAAGATALSLRGEQRRRFLIESIVDASFHRRLAERALLRGLALLQIPGQVILTQTGAQARDGETFFDSGWNPRVLRIRKRIPFPSKLEACSSARLPSRGFYAVFDFLEHQGVYFGVDASCGMV